MMYLPLACTQLTHNHCAALRCMPAVLALTLAYLIYLRCRPFLPSWHRCTCVASNMHHDVALCISFVWNKL